MTIDTATGVITSKERIVEIEDCFAHDFILKHLSKHLNTDHCCETEFVSQKSSSYGWILDRYRRVATWFHKHGISEGDRVSFYSKNYIEFVPCVLATWRVGATCSYIRPEMIADKEYRAAVGIPRIVFASEDRAGQLLEAGFENVVVLRSGSEQVLPGCTRFEELLEEEEEAAAAAAAEEKPNEVDDLQIKGNPRELLALVTFTGGTTGNPKPIQLTHYNLVAALSYELSGVPLSFGSVINDPVQLCAFPTVHITGILYRIGTLLLKAHTVLLDLPVEPGQICEAIQKHRVNVITTVPAIAIALCRFPDLKKYDLSSWENCILVGGPLLPYMQDEVKSKLGLKNLFLRLGMSECCGSVMVPTLVPGSVGHLCPNTDAMVRHIKDGSVIIKPGSVGELCIRGPQRTIGYYNLAEKTKAAIDDEGFLHTGDLVTFDEHFNFYYFDRAQEVIVHPSGNLISATELELIIAYRNPSVSEVSVIPSTNGPRAIVVPVTWPNDEDALRDELIRQTNAVITVDWAKLTGGVVFLKAQDVPRSVLGKHLKRHMKHL